MPPSRPVAGDVCDPRRRRPAHERDTIELGAHHIRSPDHPTCVDQLGSPDDRWQRRLLGDLHQDRRVAGWVPGVGTVSNNSSTASSGWRVQWTFANGQVVTQLWGGRLAQSGSAVTVTNETYNGSLGPNASTTFGFLANWNGANAVPASVTCTKL